MTPGSPSWWELAAPPNCTESTWHCSVRDHGFAECCVRAVCTNASSLSHKTPMTRYPPTTLTDRLGHYGPRPSWAHFVILRRVMVRCVALSGTDSAMA